ncbi:MAG: RNA polymerase sigma factor [Planctomycetota bacterium JB042]
MTLPPLTDSLVEAAVRNQGEARTRLLELSSGRLRGMALARLASEPDRWNAAEDIAQEALLALDRGLDRLESRTARAWLAFQSTVVSRKIADHFRERRAPERAAALAPGPDASSVGPLLGVLAASGPSPSSMAGAREAAVVALDELGALRELHREAITLALFDQLETREIGERLGMSRTSAANLLARALESLRARYAKRLAHEGSPP